MSAMSRANWIHAFLVVIVVVVVLVLVRMHMASGVGSTLGRALGFGIAA
jgi:hypothetical protein